MTRVGFTGTRYGMSGAQHTQLRKFLLELGQTVSETHHGDCIGADAEFHLLVQRLLPKSLIYVHPAIVASTYRAFCRGHVVYPPRPPLDRNLDIVNSADILFACPQTAEEEVRSGTWTTVRYARRARCKVLIIEPTGKVVRE